jgi:serine/threonine-protein kinase
MTDASAASHALAPGTIVAERYRVEALLGEGGVGAVYSVKHIHLGKHFALKVLHASLGNNDEIAQRFEREAIAASHIDHVNVAAATDFGRTADGHFFLVLEHVGGVTLRALIQKGPMEADRTLAFALQTARALAKAHALGVVHRDLKPENVMIVQRAGEAEIVKILDFGVAKVTVEALSNPSGGQPMTQLGAIYGTPGYMAPEQALGEAVDGRADLYALGVTLYEMLSGVLPFDANDVVTLLGKQVTERAPSMKTRAPSVEVPAALDAVVMRLLERQASDRYQTAEELVLALEGLRVPQSAAVVRLEPTLLVPTLDKGKGRIPTRKLPSETIRAIARSMASKAKGAWSRTAAWSSPRLGKGLAAVRSAYGKMRGRIPKKWQPALPFIVTAVALGVLALPVAFLARGKSHAKEAPRGSDSASIATGLPAASIRQAAHAGAAALEDLAREYPEDARIQRELVRVNTTEGHGAAAMRALARLTALEPGAVRDDEMSDALVAALDGPSDASAAALRVAEGPFGARGVDILLDCSSRSGPAQNRCVQTLAKTEVREHASPAAKVLLELREATDCESMRAAVEHAGDLGDSRALPELRALSRRSGCGRRGRSDCWPCLRGDRTLDDAIASIDSRSRGRTAHSAPGPE